VVDLKELVEAIMTYFNYCSWHSLAGAEKTMNFPVDNFDLSVLYIIKRVECQKVLQVHIILFFSLPEQKEYPITYVCDSNS
jgi:hypothetical protein